MKNVICLLYCLLLITKSSYSQDDWRTRLEDKWFVQYGIRGLKVGDKMPDMPLGNVMNNYIGASKFSDLRGKLVILDFWATTCSSCIEGFPQKEKLQKEFGDQIQIFLVNPYETQSQIDKFSKTTTKKFSLPNNLPSIVAPDNYKFISEEQLMNTSYLKYFPARGPGSQLWIDPNGNICVYGSYLNTNSEKIKEILANRSSVLSIADGNVVPVWPLDNKTLSYYQVLPFLKSSPITIGSFFTKFNNEINGANASSNRDVIDSLTKTRRNTWINTELLDIYIQGPMAKNFFGAIESNNTICGPDEFCGLISLPKDFDTLKITTRYLENSPETNLPIMDDKLVVLKEKGLVSSAICYEHIAPLNQLPENAEIDMFMDLNRFSAAHSNVSASWEKRNVPCYVIVRVSKVDKIRSMSKYSKPVSVSYKKVAYRKYTNFNFGQMFGEVVKSSGGKLKKELQHNLGMGDAFQILNETGWDNSKMVDMMIPEKLNSISELSNYLKIYDLAILKQDRELGFLTFKKVNN